MIAEPVAVARPFAATLSELRWEAAQSGFDVSVDVAPSSDVDAYPTIDVRLTIDQSYYPGHLEVGQPGWPARKVTGSWEARRGDFELMVGTMSLRSAIDVEIALRNALGARIVLGRIVGRLSREPVALMPAPLQLLALARSGTTLLMTLLARHPEIVVAEPFPYEIHASRYWIHALQRLLEPAEFAQSAHIETFWMDGWWVGLNPFFDVSRRRFFETRYGEALGRFACDSLAGFYRAEAEGRGKDAVRYFAEKQPPDHMSAWTAEAFSGSRRLFLVRDPRDAFASMRAFNEKRRAPAFGQESTNSDEEWLALLEEQLRQLAAQWRASGADAFLIRYEDLIAKPIDTLAEAFRFLGIAADAETVKRVFGGADHADSAFHRTTLTAEASVGRWKRDLDSDAQRLATEAFGGFLETFYGSASRG